MGAATASPVSSALTSAFADSSPPPPPPPSLPPSSLTPPWRSTSLSGLPEAASTTSLTPALRSCLSTASSSRSSDSSSPSTAEEMWAERVCALRARVVSSSSCVKQGMRAPRVVRKMSTLCLPQGSQSGVAKLDDSAQLTPCEKPAWYARGHVTTKVPGRCSRWQTLTPCRTASPGGTIVTILYMSPDSEASSSLSSDFITSSKASACSPGTPYHVLGAPQCM